MGPSGHDVDPVTDAVEILLGGDGEGQFQRSLHGGSSVERGRVLVIEAAATLSVDDRRGMVSVCLADRTEVDPPWEPEAPLTVEILHLAPLPWLRGANEHTNGLLRQYMPKGTDLSLHSADEFACIAASLNNRRRSLPFTMLAQRARRRQLAAFVTRSRNGRVTSVTCSRRTYRVNCPTRPPPATPDMEVLG